MSNVRPLIPRNVLLARQFLKEVEEALTPVLEKYKEHCEPVVWEDWKEGCSSATDIVACISETLDPLPVTGGEQE